MYNLKLILEVLAKSYNSPTFYRLKIKFLTRAQNLEFWDLKLKQSSTIYFFNGLRFFSFQLVTMFSLNLGFILRSVGSTAEYYLPQILEPPWFIENMPPVLRLHTDKICQLAPDSETKLRLPFRSDFFIMPCI